MASAAQMGRHFDLPTSSIAGITDAIDAQYGAEKSLAVAAHAGSNIITQAAGMMSSLLGLAMRPMSATMICWVTSYEPYAALRPPRKHCGDVIAGVCRGEGHYLSEMHTFNRMKSDYFYPAVGDRHALNGRKTARIRSVSWPGKRHVTLWPATSRTISPTTLTKRYAPVLTSV